MASDKKPSTAAICEALLERRGRLYSADLGLDLTRETPSVLFRWLVASKLMAARIDAQLAMQAADALAKAGWRTPEAMADASWEDRAAVLKDAGYARFDEKTSSQLQALCDRLLKDHDGDLRNVREAAGREPRAERKALKRFKGMGDVGVDIFFRETQLVWDELHPFIDKKALKTAKKLNLPGDAQGLADLVDADAFPRLVAALVRVELDGDAKRVRKHAAAYEAA